MDIQEQVWYNRGKYHAYSIVFDLLDSPDEYKDFKSKIKRLVDRHYEQEKELKEEIGAEIDERVRIMYYITAKVKYNWETNYSTKYLVSTFDSAQWNSTRIDLYTLETAKNLLKTMSERWCYYFLADDCSDYRYGEIIVDSIEIKELKETE